MRNHHPIRVAFLGLIGILACSPLLSRCAESLRVVTWTLVPAPNRSAPQPSPATLSSTLARAAGILKPLNADVIVLDHAPDWKACQELATALGDRAYTVQVCTRFEAASKAGQVAILAKPQTYFSWSESWESGGKTSQGGFAFAALQFGKRRIGLFAVLDEPAGSRLNVPLPFTSAEKGRQWARAIESYTHWEANRFDAAIIAFSSEPNRTGTLQSALSAPFGSAVVIMRGESDVFSAHLPGNAAAPAALLLGGSPLVCDVDLESSQPLRAQPIGTELSFQSAVEVRPQEFWRDPQNWGIAGASVAVLAIILALLPRRRNRSRGKHLAHSAPTALLPPAGAVVLADTLVIAPGSATASSPGDSGPVIQLESATPTQTQSQVWRENPGPRSDPLSLPPEAKAGVISEFGRWMKQLFVRKLATDRALLMQGQQAASGQLRAVDDRLAALRSQLQAQNAAYEQRIHELTAELDNAKEENRALLLLKIKELKAEMESARARLEREI